MRKKLVLVLGGVGVVLVLGAAGVVVLVDPNDYRGEIESRLEAALGREVTLGSMSLGLLPPRFQVDSTVISEAPGFPNPSSFVTAERLAVRVRLLPLLSGNLRIDSLDLDRPSVEFVRNAAGVWNFSTLGSGTASARGEDGPAASNANTFELGRLTIRDGLVGITDLGRGAERTVYDHIDLTLRDFSPGSAFSFDLTAHLPGDGAQEIGLSGIAGPFTPEHPMATPFTGALTLDEVGAEGLRAFMHTQALSSAAGSLSGETSIENDNGTVAVLGTVILENARFENRTLGFPVTLDYDAIADLSSTMVTINGATLEIGDTPLAVAGAIDAGADPPTIDVGVRADDVSVAEVARLAAAFGVAFPPDVDVEGRTGIDVRATGPASALRLNGSIQGRNLRLSGGTIPLPVAVDALDVGLTPAEIRTNEFQGRAGDTTATASIRVTDYLSDNPNIDARLEARGATLEEIQSLTRAFGVAGLDRVEGSGTLNLNLEASGPLKAVRSQSVARSLDGNLDLDFTPLAILGFDAAGELGSIVGFDDGSSTGDRTEIVTLTGHVDVDDGIAQTENLLAQLTIGQISAAGTADLAAETLDLRLAAVFSKPFSDSIREAGVGGYLDTALTNSAGELVLPVRVTGSFDEPRFVPDAEALARMQLERAIDDPAGFISGLLDPDSAREGANPEAEAETPEPVETIRGILGGLLGGRSNDQE